MVPTLPDPERRPGRPAAERKQKGELDKVIERCLTRFNKRRDALGVFGIGETLEEAS